MIWHDGLTHECTTPWESHRGRIYSWLAGLGISNIRVAIRGRMNFIRNSVRGIRPTGILNYLHEFQTRL